MKLRIVALSHVLESETCELSAFFRDDPELFAPRVILLTGLPTPWSTLSHSHPGSGEAVCLLEGGSNTQQHHHKLNTLHILLSADRCFKSDGSDPRVGFPSRYRHLKLC